MFLLMLTFDSLVSGRLSFIALNMFPTSIQITRCQGAVNKGGNIMGMLDQNRKVGTEYKGGDRI